MPDLLDQLIGQYSSAGGGGDTSSAGGDVLDQLIDQHRAQASPIQNPPQLPVNTPIQGMGQRQPAPPAIPQQYAPIDQWHNAQLAALQDQRRAAPVTNDQPEYRTMSQAEWDDASQRFFQPSVGGLAPQDVAQGLVDRGDNRPQVQKLPDGNLSVRRELFDAIRGTAPAQQQGLGQDLANVPANISASGAQSVAGLTQAAGTALNMPGRVLRAVGGAFQAPGVGNAADTLQQPGQALQRGGEYLAGGAQALQQANPIQGEVGKMAAGVGTLGIDATMGALLGPEAFTASFASRNAGQMYVNARQTGAGPDEAFGKAMIGGFTAALTPELAKVFPAEVGQTIAQQVARSYIGTGSMVAAQATLDELTLKAGTDQKIDLSQVFPEAAAQGLIGVLMHAPGMMRGARGEPNAQKSPQGPEIPQGNPAQGVDEAAGRPQAPPAGPGGQEGASGVYEGGQLRAQPGQEEGRPALGGAAGDQAASAAESAGQPVPEPVNAPAQPDQRPENAAGNEGGKQAVLPSGPTVSHDQNIPNLADTAKGIKADQIGQAVSVVGGGMVDAMYARMWDDVTSGKIDAKTAPLAEQIAARGYREGLIKNKEDMRQFVAEGTMAGEAAKAQGRSAAQGVADWYRQQKEALKPETPPNEPIAPRQEDPQGEAVASAAAAGEAGAVERFTPEEVKAAGVPDEVIARIQENQNATAEGQQPTNPPSERPGNDQGTPPESAGVGGGVPSGETVGQPEPASEGDKSVTSIKNEVVDKEREARGLPPAMKTARRELGKVWDDAMKEVDANPRVTDNLISELKDKPRALTDREDALLLHRQIELQNEHRTIADAIVKAADSGDEGELAGLKSRLAGVSDKLLELYNVGKESGTETGRGLNARKMMAAEDFSLASMEVSKRAANGGKELTPEQSKQIADLHQKIADTQKAFDDYVAAQEKKFADLQSQATHDRMVKEVKLRRPSAKYGESNRIVNRKAYEEALAALRSTSTTYAGLPLDKVAALVKVGAFHIEAGARKFTDFTARMVQDLGEGIKPHLEDIYKRAMDVVGPGKIKEKIRERLNDGDFPGISKYVQLLAKDFVANGVTDREKLIDAVHAELKQIKPDITRRETMDAISGYGQYKALNKTETLVKLRDLKGQMQQVAKLQDMMKKGQAPKKTGIERREPSQEERRLIKEVNDTKKKLGIQTTDPETQLKSTLDGIKTRLKNQIADLEYQIESGKRIERTSAPGPRDSEIKDLETRRDQLKQQFDAIFGKPEMSSEQRVKIATAALERSVAQADKDLAGAKAGRFERQGPDQQPATQVQAALRAQRDAMREEIKALKAAYEPSQQQRQEKTLERSIEELSRRIDQGDILPNGKKATADTLRIAHLKNERADMQRKLQAMREASPEYQARQQVSRDMAALQAYKTRTAARIAELEGKLARGDFSPAPPRKPIALDSEAMRLKAENERVKQQYQNGLLIDRLKNRTRWEKGQDLLVKWRRASLLSGVRTLFKLTSAAAQRIAITPLEEAAGYGYSRLMPGLASRAPREGGLSIKAEARSFTQAFTQGMRDAYQSIRTGKTPLDLVYGKKEQFPPSALDFFGNLHSALKAPAKRAEFERSFLKRSQAAISDGLDPSEPAVQMRLAIDSYKDANRSIFMQDNKVTNAWNRAMRALEEPNKKTGKVSFGAKSLATAGRVLMPIVKVPTNIIAETFQYALGTIPGGFKAISAYVKGIDKLQPAEADMIMRSLKKGSLGTAVLLLGWFNAKNVGGYYQPGEKREDSDVKVGGVRIGGVDIPRLLVHNPLLETLQIGATARRVADSHAKKSDKEPRGLSNGAMAAALGLVDEVPFVQSAEDTLKLLHPKEQGKAAGDLARSLLVPQGIQEAAQYVDRNEKGDTRQRKPENIVQAVEMGLPGLRNTVPTPPDKIQRVQAPGHEARTAAAEERSGPLYAMPLEKALQTYDQMNPADKAKYAPIIKKKIVGSKISPQDKQRLIGAVK